MLKVFLPMMLCSFILASSLALSHGILNLILGGSVLGCLLLSVLSRQAKAQLLRSEQYQRLIAYMLKLTLLFVVLYGFMLLTTNIATSQNHVQVVSIVWSVWTKVSCFYLLVALLYRQIARSSQTIMTIGGLLKNRLPKGTYRETVMITCNYFIRIMQIVSLILTLTIMTLAIYLSTSKTQLFIADKALILTVSGWVFMNVIIYSKGFLMLLRLVSIKRINLMFLMLVLPVMWVGDKLGLLVEPVLTHTRVWVSMTCLAYGL